MVTPSPFLTSAGLFCPLIKGTGYACIIAVKIVRNFHPIEFPLEICRAANPKRFRRSGPRKRQFPRLCTVLMAFLFLRCLSRHSATDISARTVGSFGLLRGWTLCAH
jgi:hypothetical protein